MGKPGAKKGDTIISVTPGDIHIVMVPAPPAPSPVPTPLPHPVPASTIKDEVAETVKVEGSPGAVKGSISKHTHTPTPPGVSFQKPPANKGKIITGSANVFYEGKEAAMLGDTAEMCADPAAAPVGKVIGTAATVLVGGGGSGSGGEGEGSGDAAKAGGAQGTGLGNPSLNQNNAACHPIDVATGNVIAHGDDFGLDGPIPLQFVRTYVSDRATERGALGHGWVHNFQERLELVERNNPLWQAIHEQFLAADSPSPDGRYLIHRDPNGLTTTYIAPGDGQETVDRLRKRSIRNAGSVWSVRGRDGVVRHFAPLPTSRSVLPLIEMVDRNGNTNTFRYDRDGRLIEIEDCYQRALRLTYEKDRLVALRVRIPGEPEEQGCCSYRYDTAGDLVEVVDRAGLTVHYAYAEHLLTREQNRDAYSFYFAYDAQRRCIATWGEDGYLTGLLRYDAAKRRTIVVNGEGETTVYHYTPALVVCRVEKAQDVFTELRFDEKGRFAARLTGSGVVSAVTYDDSDNILAITDAEGHTTTFEYNVLGQVTKLTNPLGHTQVYEYDARGNLLARTDPTGVSIRYEYDERGRVVTERHPGGLVIAIDYDRFGHYERVKRWNNTTAYWFDALGKLLLVQPPDRAPIKYEWTPTGLLAAVKIGHETLDSYEYNGEGQIITFRDGRGVVQRASFRASAVYVEASEYVTSDDSLETLRTRVHYDTDSEGRFVRAVDHLGRTLTRAYDAAGRLAREKRPDGLTIDYAYDRAGRLHEIRTDRGELQRIEYDGRGYPTAVRYADGSLDTFEHDELGRLVAATNGAGTVEYEYDAIGRQTVRRQGDFELRAEIDAAAHRVSWCWPDGIRADYETDEGGRSRALTFGGRRVDLERDPFGRLSARHYPNGVIESYRYDGFARLRGFALGRNGTLLHERALDYMRGRIVDLHDAKRGPSACKYDRLGRLSRIEGGLSESYQFDERDNIVASHRFRETRITDGDQVARADERSYAYDEQGRVATARDGDRVYRFGYDAKGQVSSVALPDGGEVHYAYDPFGRRIEKSFLGGTRDGRLVRFFWDGNSLAKEEIWTAGERHVERFYLFTGSAPLARVDREDGTERALFFHNDQVGRPVLCTDEQGEVVWESTADSYGAEPDPPGGLEQNIRLLGQYFDEETGLHYNRHRYYDPCVGRYLQPDPLFRLTDLNRYAYPTDPLVNGDPLGLRTVILKGDPIDPAIAGHPIYPPQPGPPTGHYPGSAAHLQGRHGGTTENMFDATQPNLRGVDHVIITAHGNQLGIAYYDPSAPIPFPPPPGRPLMDGTQLANYLHLRGFRGSRVTIVSCNTGAPSPEGTIVAQDTADQLAHLGVNAGVEAPNKYCGVDSNGNVVVAGLRADGKLNANDRGQMMLFQAGQAPRPA